MKQLLTPHFQLLTHSTQPKKFVKSAFIALGMNRDCRGEQCSPVYEALLRSAGRCGHRPLRAITDSSFVGAAISRPHFCAMFSGGQRSAPANSPQPSAKKKAAR
ncbi:MAG: hypothetical protein FWE47_01710 [Oscillospiraceae bacterium]|nr:hypothetical protein [Oscillospiraceae bacterium]